MSIAPGRVHQEETLVLTDGLCKRCWAFFEQNLAPASRCSGLRSGRDGDWATDSCKLSGVSAEGVGVAVDGEVSQVAHQTLHLIHLGHVGLAPRGELPLRVRYLGEFWVLVNEGRRDNARLELGVGEAIEQEGDIGLDATDAGFLQGAAHAQERLVERCAARSVLNEKRIIVRSDLEARVSNAVHPHAKSCRVAVDGEGARVGGEVLLRVLGCHAALDGDATR
mmetsp:Transcript_2631/g.5508  ORF Transcript_2631/g.5508 Transcript_2631/m.5508 type:complete len:223 (+) Transcript_2631:1797-2465(+)